MHQVLFIKLLLVYTYYLQTSPWQLAKTILVTAHYVGNMLVFTDQR